MAGRYLSVRQESLSVMIETTPVANQLVSAEVV